MSASTRTVQQQTLGNNQLGVALAVVAVAIIVAAAIAFGALNAPKAAPVTNPAIGQPPPAVIDHGWSQAGTSKGLPSTAVDHGSSEESMGYAGASSTDFGPGSGTSMGGWSGNRGTVSSGGPQLRPE
jgi:hypothetical protein